MLQLHMLFSDFIQKKKDISFQQLQYRCTVFRRNIYKDFFFKKKEKTVKSLVRAGRWEDLGRKIQT